MSEFNHDYEHRNVIPTPGPRPHIPSLFWPIILIVGGIVLLLSNLGYLPEPSWYLLSRFWPVILIALGIDVLVGRRSVAGAIIGGIFIFLLLGAVVLAVFFAQQIPLLAEMARGPEMEHRALAHPAAGLESASVLIDWTDMPGTLYALDDSDQLIEAEVDYYGTLAFNVEGSGDHADVQLDSYQEGFVISFGDYQVDDGVWKVGLNPDIVYDLDLDGGSGSNRFDLGALQVNALKLDVGSGATDLTLPEASTFEGEIDGGAGRLTLTLPEGVGLRITLNEGSGSFKTDARFVLAAGDEDAEEMVWKTTNYDTAKYMIDLNINQGSGNIEIR